MDRASRPTETGAAWSGETVIQGIYYSAGRVANLDQA